MINRVADHLVYDLDFPHPDWGVIDGAIGEVEEAQRPALRRRVVQEWLAILRDHLGGDYRVAENDRVVLLSELSEARAREEISFIEKSIEKVRDCLGPNAKPLNDDRQIILVFSEEDDYYAYISHFFPDGHFGLSMGVQIRLGFEHIAICRVTFKFHDTLVHELGHVLLSHLGLPQWVEEGIVQQLARYVLDQPPMEMYTEVSRSFAQAWHWHGLAAFWDGSAFSRPDDLCWHAYQLAELMTRQMNRRDEAAFDQFVAEAQAADAGEAACRKHFGVSLIVLVEQLLGSGPWLVPDELLIAKQLKDDELHP